ncbi:hypothetical protein MMC08_003789 [Hypocenomyce scalaris]|nr:hypothetical protein [Hypocenomyce scalaris]
MAFEMPGIAQGKETVVSEKPSGITSRIDSQDEVWPTSFHHGHTSIVATFIYTIALEFNSLANTIWGILAYALAEIGVAVIFSQDSVISKRPSGGCDGHSHHFLCLRSQMRPHLYDRFASDGILKEQIDSVNIQKHRVNSIRIQKLQNGCYQPVKCPGASEFSIEVTLPK